MRFPVAWLGLLLGLSLLVFERPALAQLAAQAQPEPMKPPLVAPPEKPSLWRSEWPQYRTSELITSLAAGLATGAIVLYGPIEEPRWKGGILFDDAVRDALRARNPHTHQTFRTIGDYTYHLSPLLPLFDALVVSTVGHSDSKLAGNLTGITLEAYSYSGLLSFIATETSARQRPDGTTTQSFFSGHAAISATGAGLTCANHTRIPLWGNRVADISACVIASLNALTTATTRVVADRHYATDVILGTGVGFGFGYAVPVLLHYSYHGAPTRISFVPDPSCGPSCIGMRGTF
ncbi:MAG: phosphatase PAP2 family protein [Polyangiaceae bacterium]